MNNITIVGRMTDDPFVRKVNIGGVETSVCNFYVAVDEGFGAKKNTEFFHNVLVVYTNYQLEVTFCGIRYALSNKKCTFALQKYDFFRKPHK